MFITGYFTTESNVRGLSTREMEVRLGFRPGRLTHGARILVLDREPLPGEFEPVGSTRYSSGQGLDKDQLHRTKFRPGAWIGEHLVKVEPVLPDSGFEWYPNASTAVEQWKLTSPVTGHEVRTLAAGETYWG